jgi:hypothetical protein
VIENCLMSEIEQKRPILILAYEEFGAPSSESKVFSASSSDPSSSVSTALVSLELPSSPEAGMTRISFEIERLSVEAAEATFARTAWVLFLAFGALFSAVKLLLAAKALSSGAN